MGYTEVASLEADVTIALGGKNRKTGKTNPTEVEGYYLGNRQVADSKKKSGYSYIHFFQTANGNIGVWGKTDLDRKLLTVTPGTMTLATFDRMVPTPNGDMYKFKVSVDKDNTIEVATNSSSNFDDADSGSEYTTSEDAQDDADEDAAQDAALTAAARKAQVEALLNRGKTNGKAKN